MKRNRQNLDDGGWFDLDAATLYEEGQEWDGNNNISCATGSQWTHEELYLTSKGRWVLHAWSQWQGSRPHWTRIESGAAREWLCSQGHYSALTDEQLDAMEA